MYIQFSKYLGNLVLSFGIHEKLSFLTRKYGNVMLIKDSKFICQNESSFLTNFVTLKGLAKSRSY